MFCRMTDYPGGADADARIASLRVIVNVFLSALMRFSFRCGDVLGSGFWVLGSGFGSRFAVRGSTFGVRGHGPQEP